MKVRDRECEEELVLVELREAAPEEEDVAGEGAVSAGTGGGAEGAEAREDANVEEDLEDLVEAEVRAGGGERSSSSSELV